MTIRLVALLGVCALGLSTCQSSQPDSPQQMGRAIPKPSPTLEQAIGTAVDLGPADLSTMVYLSFGLKGRNQEALAGLLASGKTITPSAYAADFAPEPALVERAVSALRNGGLNASWQPPSSLIAADGPAPAASSVLRVNIESYRRRSRWRLSSAMSAGLTITGGLTDTRSAPAGSSPPTSSATTTSSHFAMQVLMAAVKPSCFPRSTTSPT